MRNRPVTKSSNI